MALRKTKQRTTLLAALRAAGRPVTRAELWALAKERLPSVGFATVSRAVNEWLAEATVVRVDYPGQPTRYEIASHREHPHFVCVGCQKTFDLDLAMPDVALPTRTGGGFEITAYEVLFFGKCAGCQKAPV